MNWLTGWIILISWFTYAATIILNPLVETSFLKDNPVTGLQDFSWILCHIYLCWLHSGLHCHLPFSGFWSPRNCSSESSWKETVIAPDVISYEVGIWFNCRHLPSHIGPNTSLFLSNSLSFAGRWHRISFQKFAITVQHTRLCKGCFFEEICTYCTWT